MPSLIKIVVLNIVAVILAYYYYDIKLSDFKYVTGAKCQLIMGIGVYLVIILIASFLRENRKVPGYFNIF
ncbi:hypothetical protein CAEBREN_02287 [Caenorhabditis brenneri]|uniref:Uncharacterized protein n=1 Tax=Caenorhabditis brenneri TaxID=135651 RepID=G0PAW4_CAEBE|nr:hypothetical protein CAEBREN_02287 [Caenorhabditis brenneri]